MCNLILQEKVTKNNEQKDNLIDIFSILVSMATSTIIAISILRTTRGTGMTAFATIPFL